MTKRRRYTQEQKTEALKLYETHGTSAASKQLNIPKSTIDRWRRDAGVGTVRMENVRARVEAAQADHAERRAQIIGRLYGLTEASLGLVEDPAEYQTILKGEGGIEAGARPGFIPAQDKQREMTAIGIMLDKAANLEKFDQDSGSADARGLLSALRDQIGMRNER